MNFSPKCSCDVIGVLEPVCWKHKVSAIAALVGCNTSVFSEASQYLYDDSVVNSGVYRPVRSTLYETFKVRRPANIERSGP